MRSVSLIWCVMSAVLLKIAHGRTTGRGVTGVNQGVQDESQGACGSYNERQLEEGLTLEMGVFGHVVCDVKVVSKNRPALPSWAVHQIQSHK